jgi:hypothetical protein
MRRLLHRLVNVFRPHRAEPELSREIDAHLTLLEDDFRRRGLTPDEARLAARRASGGVEQTKERHRDERSFVWLDDARRDLQYAARTLRRNPGFAATAILTLALGIGANTAIFSLVNTLMLRALPVREPGQLVELLSHYPGDPPFNGFAWKYYEHYRDQNHVFSDLIGTSSSRFQVSGEGLEAQTVDGEYVVGTFFTALGVQPAVGRLIEPRDDTLGSPNAAVAVVSWPYWKSTFNSSPDILGKHIVVDGLTATVVGVAAREFSGLEVGSSPSVWVPAAMAALMQRLDRQPNGPVDASIVPERLIATLSGVFGALGELLAAIGLYGLLAYTVTRRTNEIGIRMALGATARDVVGSVLKSALALAGAGLIVGAPMGCRAGAARRD